MKKSYKIALGGLIMALSVIIMALTTVIPIASFAFPAIAGVILVILSLETSKKWALLVYLGVSLLSIFLSSDHTAVISYIVFFGYYPILKEVIECLRERALEWVIKYAVFNLAIIIGVSITFALFGLDYLMLEYGQFGAIGIIAFYLGVNGVFAVFDIALSRVITVIIIKVLPILRKLK